MALTLNSMVLDGGVDQEEFTSTWKIIDEVAKMKAEMKDSLEILLLTHLPLHKPKGACVDHPFIRWTEGTDKVPIEQNMLSPRVSQIILDKIKPKYIFNGHDHHGCQYKHKEGTLEYTIRAVQGDFGGNVALFEFRENASGDIEYQYKDCSFYPTKALVGYFIGVGVWLACVILVLVLRLVLYILCCGFVKSGKKVKAE